jgi:multidrug efflux system membrane fusion protein
MQLIHGSRRRTLKVLGIAFIAVCIAIALHVVMHPVHGAGHAATAAAPVPVVTAAVIEHDVASYRTGIGTVQAAQSVTVKARVDGQLEQVAFTEGQEVKQGDLLAQIDARPYQAQRSQAIAQKARDAASLGAALKDLDRYSTLVAQGVIQQQTLDAERATVDQLKASEQSDQAQIDNAEVQLGYTSIRASLSGRTGMRLIDAGNIVHAADATGLVVINQIDPIAVVFTLPEGDFQIVNRAIQSSGNIALRATAVEREAGTLLGTGHLLLVNNQIDTATGTFQLKALFANPTRTLWPGQYVNVSLEIGVRHNALTVPQAAVQRGADGLFVYVVNADHSVAVQPVRVAQNQDDQAIVDAGLTANERVVVDGQFKIKPGAQVVDAAHTDAAASKRQSGASQ